MKKQNTNAKATLTKHETEKRFADLGKRLKAFRKACDLTQVCMAESLNVTCRHYQRYEAGSLKIPNDHFETLKKISNKYNLVYDDYFWVTDMTPEFTGLTEKERLCSLLYAFVELVNDICDVSLELTEKSRD